MLLDTPWFRREGSDFGLNGLLCVLDAGETGKLMGRGARRHLARSYLVLQFAKVAGRALAAGFNAIDVKITHGYLLSELSGAKVRPGLECSTP